MNIFITGSSSFIGREVITQALARGLGVSGIDSVPENFSTQFSVADIRSKDIDRLIPENTDAIIHLAALSRDSDCKGKALACFDVNVMGTLNLLNAAQKKNVKQFIFASSEWVYDNCTPDVQKNEETLVDIRNHSSEYALSKLVSELNLKHQYNADSRMAMTILRLGIVYGPRKTNWSAVESLFNQVANLPEVRIGSLKTARCFIHVKDVAKGILSSLGQDGFKTFNIQGPELVSLESVIENSKKILSKNPKIIEKNSQQVSVRNISNQKAKNELSFIPEYTIYAGLNTLKGIADVPPQAHP